MAKSHVDFEYPLHAGVAPDPILKPFDRAEPAGADDRNNSATTARPASCCARQACCK